MSLKVSLTFPRSRLAYVFLGARMPFRNAPGPCRSWNAAEDSESVDFKGDDNPSPSDEKEDTARNASEPPLPGGHSHQCGRSFCWSLEGLHQPTPRLFPLASSPLFAPLPSFSRFLPFVNRLRVILPSSMETPLLQWRPHMRAW